MENYDLSIDNIKEKNWVIQKAQESLANFKNKINQENKPEDKSEDKQENNPENKPEDKSEDKQENNPENKLEDKQGDKQETPVESGDFFYEKTNDEKVILKMDIVINYLKNIKDTERADLRSTYSFAWIMAVQIALRSPKIWWENHNKYWEIKIDGFLGPETKTAVEKFQTEYWLQKIDWLPGKETMNKMYELLTWEVSIAKSDGESGEWEGNKDESWEWNDDVSSEWNKESVDNWNKWQKDSKEKVPNSKIVPIKDYISDIKYDLKYATKNNSFKTKIYPDWESNLKLRYDAVQKLMKAQETLKSQWYELKILDAYRPKDAQQKLYDNYRWPSSTKGSNVAYPWTSHHGTWKAVDLTMVDSNWNEVEMPTWFDDFSWKATWSSINKLGSNNVKRKNAYILRKAMEQAWFYTISSEWRHYQIDKWKSTLSHV